MTISKYLTYKPPKFFSPDGKGSPVFDYLLDLIKHNPSLGKRALSMLKELNKLVYLNQHVEPFREGKFRCIELKVRYKNDVCRFFFVADEPYFIVFHGFTKKTRKTEEREVAHGLKNLQSYLYSKNAIELVVFM
jgi:phage-related protein